MQREWAVVGAPSSIGIRPYRGGRPRGLDRAPTVLREHGLVSALGAVDLGDVYPPPYRDFRRPARGIRNEAELVAYSRDLGSAVAAASAAARRVLVLGGDCSIVLGSLLGVAARVHRRGLVYVDAHADFATPEESVTGSAAAMCLAHAVGRGTSPLARLAGTTPLVEPRGAVLVGRRDPNDPDGDAALLAFGVREFTGAELERAGGAAVSAAVIEHLVAAGADGFWVHFDADVLDPRLVPAVDSPETGGPGVEELTALLRPLVQHPLALGVQVTIYDPDLDADGAAGRVVASVLERIAVPDARGVEDPNRSARAEPAVS